MSNTITAFFKGRKGVCESVYQHDYGMVMVIDGIDFTNDFDCYFSTTGQDEAIPAIGSDNRVAIPNDCLTRAGDVTLHIPSHTGSNDSEVEYVVTFKVIGRARPADDGSAEEQSALSKAIALLNHTNSSVIETINSYLDENAAEPISDWLDEHPEATTTVQDGAITEAKLHNDVKEKLDSSIKKDIVNDLMSPNPFVGNEMINMFKEYIESGVFHYGFMPTVDQVYTVTDADYDANKYNEQLFPREDVVGKIKIDCSTLVHYITSGIEFRNSIFNGGSNLVTKEWAYDWSEMDFTNDGTINYGRPLANSQAYHCMKQGYLFEPKEDWSNVQIGDLFFLNNENPSYGFWHNIGHVAIVIGKSANGNIFYMESSSTAATGLQIVSNAPSSERLSTIEFCARLPLNSAKVAQPHNISLWASNYSNRDITGTVKTAYLYSSQLTKPIEKNKVYTCILKADLENVAAFSACYPVLSGSSGGYIANVLDVKHDGIYKFVFHTYGNNYEERFASKTFTIRMYNHNNSDYSFDLGDGIHVDWCMFLEGSYEANEFITPAIFRNTGETFTWVSKYASIAAGKFFLDTVDNRTAFSCEIGNFPLNAGENVLGTFSSKAFRTVYGFCAVGNSDAVGTVCRFKISNNTLTVISPQSTNGTLRLSVDFLRRIAE